MEVLGIDVGASGIKAAIVNTKTGQLVTERYRIPTPKGAKPNDIADEIKQLLEHFNWTGKIGVGFPAVIIDGVAQSAGNIHKSWIGVNVGELFKKYTKADFIVANDADVAGLAEINFGAGRNENGLILMITAGTGIGSGAFYNKELIPNFELGVFPYKGYKKIEHFAADSARKREKISLKEWAKRFNKFLKIIEKMFTPSLIILGGGSSKKMEHFKNQITIETKIVPAQMLNNAGIIGAAMLCELVN